VFGKKMPRQDRRQQVMVDLIDLDPLERRIRMNRAVADGDIHADEMEALLKTASRLDDLRVMEFPSAYRSRPPSELIGVAAKASSKTSKRAGSGGRSRRRVAIDVSPQVVVVSPARADAMRAIGSSSGKAASAGKTGKRDGGLLRRLNEVGDQEARKVRARRPVAVPVFDDDGPNISWLRPPTE
jgi:hypothetical protein